MAFQVSPGVNVSEIDLTASIPSVSVSTGAIAGTFNWGPVDQIVAVSSETELVNRFGAPDSNTAGTFFPAASFLAYSNDLRVVRAGNSGTLNAIASANTSASPSAILIKNEETYAAAEYLGTGDEEIAFAARYAGPVGNSLKISICTDSVNYDIWDYKDAFDSAPGTSPYVEARDGSDDEMHIVVVDEDGVITGTANTIIEKFSFVSKASDAKNSDGSSNYYKEVLFAKSRYVYWVNHPTPDTVTTNWGSAAQGTSFGTGDNYSASFEGGAVGEANTSAIVSAYDQFSNSESVDISLIITGDANSGNTAVISKAIDIADTRKDCVAFFSPPLANAQSATAATDVAEFANGFATRSSYAVMDSGWKYMYDKYNDVYRWVALNGDVAGLCARTDNERDPWFSPAGFQRGQIRNLIKLAYNPNKTERDTLYKAGVNPVVSFPGEGTVLFGDKTFQNRASAFDRINVRRLFIVLEKAISRAARASLFEFNDEFTRAQFVSLVEPFLRTVQGRRGITDFRVVCDESNNTSDVIDRNEFVGDIYIKPARSINYIQLNFVSVRTGVAFEEIVGRF
jgi:hypothetical protein